LNANIFVPAFNQTCPLCVKWSSPAKEERLMETTMDTPKNRAVALAAAGALVAGAIGAAVLTDDAALPVRGGKHAHPSTAAQVEPAYHDNEVLASAWRRGRGPFGSVAASVRGPSSWARPSTSRSSPSEAAATPHRLIVTLPSYEGGQPPSATPPTYEGGEPPALIRDDDGITFTFGRSGTLVPPTVDRGEPGTFNAPSVTIE
jgi:hypothetical protein